MTKQSKENPNFIKKNWKKVSVGLAALTALTSCSPYNVEEVLKQKCFSGDVNMVGEVQVANLSILLPDGERISVGGESLVSEGNGSFQADGISVIYPGGQIAISLATPIWETDRRVLVESSPEGQATRITIYQNCSDPTKLPPLQ